MTPVLPTSASTYVLAGVAAVLACSIVLLLVRRPWLAPWLAVPVFATSAELQLRVAAGAGVVKDGVVAVLVVATAVTVHRHRDLLQRLRRWRAPLAAMGVVVALYAVDPSGPHDADWLFSTRLVVETVALLLVALLTPVPARTLRHLVGAVATVTAGEAVLAWVQQAVGEDTLVYSWGYQFGAQVRLTSSGGLRTSGTFADPFQLAALGIVALCLGLFVARRWTAAVLIVAAGATVAATSVRTALVQVAVVGLIWALHRGWRREAASVLAAVAAIGLFVGLTVTTSAHPGAPGTPLLFGLNGRFTAWRLAVDGPFSLLAGNGVATIGSGSDRAASGLVSSAATFDPTGNPVAVFAGNRAFLDSAYAQVQSDLGLFGSLALALWLVGSFVVLLRRRGPLRVPHPAARLGAAAVLAAGVVDWIGRTTLFAFPGGFLLLFVFGVLAAADEAPAARFGRPVADWGRFPRRGAAPSTGAVPPATPTPATTTPASATPATPTPADAGAVGERLARLGVVAAVASRTFGRLVGVGFVVVLARTSGDDTVAVYGYLLGTATLVVTLTDLGVAAVAGRDVAAGRFPAAVALAAALPAQVVSVALACLVTLGLVAVSGPSALTPAPVLLTLAFLAANGMVNLWAELLRGTGRVVFEGGLQMLSAVLMVGGGLAVVAGGGGATPLLAVVAGKELVVLAVGAAVLRPRRRPEVLRTRALIRHSLHVAVAGTALIVLWRQGTILVGATGTVATLAVYVVASRFLDAGVTVANTVGFGLLPGASSVTADHDRFAALARRYLRFTAGLGALVGAAGVVVAGPLTTGLFGSRWEPAVPVVRVVALTALPLFVGYVAWFLLLAARQQRWLAGASSSGAVVAILVSLLWSRFGPPPIAAAGGTAVGAAVLAVLLLGRLVLVLRRAAPTPTPPGPEPLRADALLVR
ncbi:lipopolysaccharide biosynthesis protein [Jatrophihabitans sp. YIM 134969]